MLGLGIGITKEVPSVGNAVVTYLRDEFTDTLAAGAVDGTDATPGPGVRNVTDVEDKLLIGGGTLSWTRHTVDNQEPFLYYSPSVARVPGVTAHFRVRQTNASGAFMVALDDTSAETNTVTGQAKLKTQGITGDLIFIVGDAHNTGIGTSFVGQNNWAEYAIVIKAVGAQLWQKSGETWAKIAEYNDGVGSPLYFTATPIYVVTSAAEVEIDFVRITSAPPEGIPAPTETIIEFQTTLDGTFAPSVTKTGTTAIWIIDGTQYTTNTPSVALTGGTVDVKLIVSDPETVTRFIAINQGVVGVPTNLSELTNLERLHLTGADIDAALSSLSWVWTLTSLEQLWLDNTGLTGSIPASISSLTALELLYLNTNSLSGQIPWSSLPATLTQCYLNTNDLVGGIEAECANMTGLIKLRLDSNDLTTYEDGALDISTLTEIRLQDNVRMPEVVVDGLLNDFDGYASKAASGTLNLNNCAAPSADSADARTNLATDSWTVTVDATAGYQRIVTFEASPLGVAASGNGTENATILPEARYRHGDTIFPSTEADGTAVAEVVASDGGVTPYEGDRMLKLAITGADADGQDGARWLTRWRHNEGAGSPLPDTHYYSCMVYLPEEVMLDGTTSGRFNNLFQGKWNSPSNGSQAMLSLNSGKPSSSPNPSIYQFYWNNKQLGLDQLQFYQASPIAIPIATWFALELKLTFATLTGSDVNADGTVELWQGIPGGTITKIFDLSGVRTRYDDDADGRLNWGPCAYGKGIVGGALTMYIDNVIISPTRVYT